MSVSERILVGIPTFARPVPEFAIESLAPLFFDIGRRTSHEIGLCRESRTYRHIAREAIARSLVDDDWDRVLFLDDDMVFEPSLFRQLRQTGEDFVSALYFMRGLPTRPCAFKTSGGNNFVLHAYPKNALIEVDAVGFGAVLIHRRVFEAIPSPWFNIEKVGLGEDMEFCRKTRAAGIKIHLHTGIKIGHAFDQPYVITEKDYDPKLAIEAERTVPKEGQTWEALNRGDYEVKQERPAPSSA